MNYLALRKIRVDRQCTKQIQVIVHRKGLLFFLITKLKFLTKFPN